MSPSHEALPQQEVSTPTAGSEQQGMPDAVADSFAFQGLRRFVSGRQGSKTDEVRSETVRSALGIPKPSETTPPQDPEGSDEATQKLSPGQSFIEQQWRPKQKPQMDPSPEHLPVTWRGKLSERGALAKARKFRASLRDIAETERTFPELNPLNVEGKRKLSAGKQPEDDARKPAEKAAIAKRQKKQDKFRKKTQKTHSKQVEKSQRLYGKLEGLMGQELVGRINKANEYKRTQAEAEKEELIRLSTPNSDNFYDPYSGPSIADAFKRSRGEDKPKRGETKDLRENAPIQAQTPEQNNPTNYPIRNSEPAEAVEPHEIDANIDFEDKAREIHEAVQEEIKHRREVYSNFMVQEALDSTIAEEAQEMYQEEIEKEIGMPFDEAVQIGGAHQEVALGLLTALKDIRDGKISEVQQKPAEAPAPAQEIKPATDTDLFMNPVKIMSLRKKIDGKVKKDKENFLKNNPGQKFNREQVWQQVKSDVLPGYLGISKEGLNNPDVVGANDLDELEYMLTMDWAELQKLADETKNNQKPSPDTVVKVRDTSYEDLQKRFPNA